MDEDDGLADRFEAHRGHLRAVAYRMLGSLAEADDAVQEAWLRLSRADTSAVENLAGWLTTVVSRVCLDLLRSRTSRREVPLDLHDSHGGRDGGPASGGDRTSAGPSPGAGLGPGAGDGDGLSPEAGLGPGLGLGPEDEAVLAESVGLALLVVLDTLAPAERIAFVLHDLFAVPFDEVAPVVDRSPVAAKKLASRARRRMHGTPTIPVADLTRHRHVVDAFLAASRGGDIDALLAVLDPDVVRRADRAVVPAGAATELRGARAVVDETLTNLHRARFARPALVDGTVGVVVAPGGRLVLALRLTIEAAAEVDRIVAIDVVADPARLLRLDLAVLDLAG